MSWELQAAVGLNNDGSFCPNRRIDQQIVAELLMKIPLPAGGLMSSLDPLLILPPITTDGYISDELVSAIHTFQAVHSTQLNIDRRVEPGGLTWLAMVGLASVPPLPVMPVVHLVLDPVANRLEEAPPVPASGFPAIAYKLTGEQLVYDDGRLRISIALEGAMTGAWGESFGIACTVNPSLRALDQAVKSGSARQIGATALEQACHELSAETRFAAHKLFSAVSVSMDPAAPGTFKMSGSLGDKWTQVSTGFEPPNTVTASGSLTVSETAPLAALGGRITFSGTLGCTIKVTLRDPVDPASVGALIAVALVGAVLVPIEAPWIATASTVQGAETAVAAGVTAGLQAIRTILGPTPSLL